MHPQLRFILIITAICLAPVPAFTQSVRVNYPNDPSSVYSTENYLTTFENIPSPNFGIINCIVRDNHGFLWFGTTKGLCKYDGYQVKVLTHESPFVSNILTMIMFDANSLLLGTGKGLWIFDLRTEEFSRFLIAEEEELSQGAISALASDTARRIWIGTNTSGLYCYERTTRNLNHYTTTNGLSDNQITSLLIDQSGIVWIGTFTGLHSLSTTTYRITSYRKTTETNSLWSDHIISLCEGSNRELWIGTDDGLNVLDMTQGKIRRLELPSPIRHAIWAMVYDQSKSDNTATGKMWIAAAEFGLLSFSDGKFSQFTTSNDVSRSLSSVKVLYLDPVVSTGSNLLFWIGTRHGVNKVLMTKNVFSNHIRNQKSLQLNRGAVLSFCEDHAGILWLGLWGGGLNGLLYKNNTYQRIYNFEKNPANSISLPNNDIGSIIEDRTGNIWIATVEGLAMLDRQRRHLIVDKHRSGDSTSLISNTVNRIYEDRSGNIWVSTNRGLSRLIPGTPHRFQNYLHQQTDAHPYGRNEVTDILEDHAGNIWAATFSRGLNKFESNGTFTRFTHPADTTGNMENFIYTVVKDGEGKFWLSTGPGLTSFNPRSGVFQRYRIDQLYDAHIFGIVPEPEGNLWLSTSIGLVKYNPHTGTFIRYDEKHGIVFRELFSGFFRNKRGNLLVGGVDGFTEFSPKNFPQPPPQPQIVITGFTVFDKEFPLSSRSADKIDLSYDQNFFSISFAALDYINPAQNKFAYRMFGINDQWIEAGTHNYASYTHLDPGEYIFQVKGSNSEHVWNESGTSIIIMIAPPYWQTWWFRLIMVLVIGTMMYAAYRYRLRKLIEVERLRLRIADDLHDDLGSNLSTIAMASRSLQRSAEITEGTRNKLRDIYDTALLTSEGMKDIVWFIKPENDLLDNLLLRMKDTASSMLGDMKHEDRWPKNAGVQRITVEFKRNFFLAFKEILTNIVKHASATKVEIVVELREDILLITINDNGQGFNEHSTRRGNGLHSIQTRAKNLGGHCEIISQKGMGTTVTFSGKL